MPGRRLALRRGRRSLLVITKHIFQTSFMTMRWASVNINIQRWERMRLRGLGATKERELDARSLEKKYKND